MFPGAAAVADDADDPIDPNDPDVGEDDGNARLVSLNRNPPIDADTSNPPALLWDDDDEAKNELDAVAILPCFPGPGGGGGEPNGEKKDDCGGGAMGGPPCWAWTARCCGYGTW